jgi:two-component system nitrogen regulation response regulator GlnG
MPEHLPQPSAPMVIGGAGDDVDAGVVEAVRQWAEQNVVDPQWAGRLYERLIAVVEPPLLSATMHQHKGQCAAAARRLGIHRTTLRKKLTDHGLGGDAVVD